MKQSFECLSQTILPQNNSCVLSISNQLQGKESNEKTLNTKQNQNIWLVQYNLKTNLHLKLGFFYQLIWLFLNITSTHMDENYESGGESTRIIHTRQIQDELESKQGNLLSKSPVAPKETNLNPTVFVIASLILSACLFAFFLHQPNTHRGEARTTLILQGAISQPFPKILWIVHNRQFGGLTMIESIIAKHQIKTAKESGFQVRIVDPVNAYDWLSPATTEMVRRAKHNSTYYIEVAQVLRIALLAQHGGLSIGPNSHLFIQDLKWVQEMMGDLTHTEQKLISEGVLKCSGGADPSAVLFERKEFDGEHFDEAVLIARPNSQLIREVFEEMIDVLVSAQPPHNHFMQLGDYKKDKSAFYMNGLFSKLMTFRKNFWDIGSDFCSRNKVTVINEGQGSIMRARSHWIKIGSDFTGTRQNYLRENGPTKIINADLRALTDEFRTVVSEQNIRADKDSYFSEIINIEENRWLLTPNNRTRQVSFCIISLKPLSINDYSYQMGESLKRLQKQCFKNWKAAFFVKGLPQKVEKVSDKPKVILVNASDQEGLNLQRAATQHCSPSDIGVVLDYDESFEATNSLRRIADKFADRRVYAAFVSTKVGEQVTRPDPNMIYHRESTQTNYNNFRELATNMRAFSLFAYRFVPNFDLHHRDGRYHNRQLPFYTMVQFATSDCSEQDAAYHLKSLEARVEVPRIRTYLDDIVVQMPTAKEIDFTLPEYITKFNVKNWCFGISQYIKYIKVSLDDYFVMNDGAEFEGGQLRKKHLPQLIPRKIHQIWIGPNQIPLYKNLFMEKLIKLHPTYEYRLWGNNDITRENFPQTYDMIQALFRIDKTSVVRKFASIADLMRLEIIYRHGGFYLDTNYYLFHNHTFDDWLTFKAVLPGQCIPNYKVERENGFFGASKGFKNLGRLLDHMSLSTINLVNPHANHATGPFYWTRAIRGMEEFDPEILVLPQDHIYPFYGTANLCQVNTEIPKEQLLFRNRYTYKKDCDDLYYWAFGMDFLDEGGTWRG